MAHSREVPKLRVVLTTVALVLGSALGVQTTRADARARSWADIPSLGRVNVIEGDRSGMIEVRVPRRAEFDLTLAPYRKDGPNPGVQISGGGRAAGVALAPLSSGGGVLFGSGMFFLSGRFAECDGASCDPETGVVNFQQPFVYRGLAKGDESGKLNAGIYRLFLVADGEPVRVRLVLEGLRGRTRIAPSEPAPVDLKTPTVRVSQLEGPSYYAAGDTFAGGEHGVAISMLSVHGPPDPVDSGYGMCSFYRTTVNLPDDVAYGPHCHATVAGASAIGGWRNDDRFDVVFYHGYTNAGFPPSDLTRGQGVWFTSRSPITRVSSHIFTLVLD